MAFTAFPISTNLASTNPFPSVRKVEQAAASVSTPSAGEQKEFIDSTTHHVNRKDSSAAVTDIETIQKFLSADPSSPANGDWWITVSGVSPSRTAVLKIRDAGATVSLQTWTF